jgi:hypothetical protein
MADVEDVNLLFADREENPILVLAAPVKGLAYLQIENHFPILGSRFGFKS